MEKEAVLTKKGCRTEYGSLLFSMGKIKRIPIANTAAVWYNITYKNKEINQ